MTLRITKKKIIFRKKRGGNFGKSCLSCKENKNEDNKNWSRLTWLRFAIAEQRGVHVDEEDHAAEVEVKVEPFVERRRYVGGYYFGHGKGDSHYDQQLPVESAKSRRKGVAVQQTETIVVSTVERERWTERESSGRHFSQPFFTFSSLSTVGNRRLIFPVHSYLFSRTSSATFILPSSLLFFSKQRSVWNRNEKKRNVEAPGTKRQWRYHWPQIHPPP